MLIDPKFLVNLDQIPALTHMFLTRADLKGNEVPGFVAVWNFIEDLNTGKLVVVDRQVLNLFVKPEGIPVDSDGNVKAGEEVKSDV